MPIEAICENCEQPFYCYPSEVKAGRKYCSLTCRSAHRFEQTIPSAKRTAIPFTCQECGNPFTMMQSYLTAYRKKFDRDPLFCSMDCSAAAQRKRAEERNKFTCVNCGKESFRHRKDCGRIYTEQKLCSKQCKNEWVSKLYREKHGTPQITKRTKRRYTVLEDPGARWKARARNP